MIHGDVDHRDVAIVKPTLKEEPRNPGRCVQRMIRSLKPVYAPVDVKRIVRFYVIVENLVLRANRKTLLLVGDAETMMIGAIGPTRKTGGNLVLLIAIRKAIVGRQSVGETLLEAEVGINPKEGWVLGSLAVAYASVGETEKLDAIIGRLADTLKLDPSTEYDVAVALCRLNRFDECLEYAHRAVENDFPMAMIAADPDLAPVVERLNVAS